MNCIFCDFELEKSENYFTGFECANHLPIHVAFFPDDMNPDIITYYTINNGKFEICVYLYPPSRGTHDKIFYLSRLDNGYKTVYSSDKIPEINPDNFEKKIKTLMVFM